MKCSSKARETDAYGRSTGVPPEAAEGLAERLFHHRAYEKFFEGYTEYSVIRPNGTRRLERIYTGVLYRQEQSAGQRIRIRVLYLVLFAVAMILLIGALILPVASNHCWYVALSELPAIILFVRLLYALVPYVISAREMQICTYRNGAKALPGASRLAAYATVLPVCVSIAMFLLEPGTWSVPELFRLVLFLAAGLVVLVIGLCESKIRYAELPPHPSVRSDGG